MNEWIPEREPVNAWLTGEVHRTPWRVLCPAGCRAQDALLLLLTPLVAGLGEMEAQRLYLSDLPLHGLARDFVLLAAC